MSYEHILVAVDLTEECDPVIKKAINLALGTHAKLFRPALAAAGGVQI